MVRARIITVAIAALLILVPAGLKAQSDFCTWSAADLTHKFTDGRFSAGLYMEYRTRYSEDSPLGFDQFYLRPKFTWKPVSWVAVTLQGDYAFYPEDRKIRLMPQVKFTYPVGPLSLSLRQRAQIGCHRTEAWSVLHRSMLSLQYDPEGCPVKPYIAAEPFYSLGKEAAMNRVRWYAGAKVKLTDALGLSLQYVRQQFQATGKHNDDIVFLIINIDI